MSANRLRHLGPRVRALRVRRGWTQERLAEEVGVSQGTITHVESGRRLPSLPVLCGLAQALGVTADELLGGAGE